MPGITKTKMQYVTSIADMVYSLWKIYDSRIIHEIPNEKPRLKAHFIEHTKRLNDELDKLIESIEPETT